MAFPAQWRISLLITRVRRVCHMAQITHFWASPCKNPPFSILRSFILSVFSICQKILSKKMISLLLTTMCFSVYCGLSCRGTIWMSFQSIFCEEDKASFHIQMELLESFVRQRWLAGVTWVMKLVRMLMLNKASQQQRLSPGFWMH